MLEQHQTRMSLMRADLTSWLLDQRHPLTSDNAAAQLTLIFRPLTCSEEGCLGCPGSLMSQDLARIRSRLDAAETRTTMNSITLQVFPAIWAMSLSFNSNLKGIPSCTWVCCDGPCIHTLQVSGRAHWKKAAPGCAIRKRMVQVPDRICCQDLHATLKVPFKQNSAGQAVVHASPHKSSSQSCLLNGPCWNKTAHLHV